jgi:hypothetical protein
VRLAVSVRCFEWLGILNATIEEEHGFARIEVVAQYILSSTPVPGKSSWTQVVDCLSGFGRLFGPPVMETRIVSVF